MSGLTDSLVLTAWGMGFVFLVLGAMSALFGVLLRLDAPKAQPRPEAPAQVEAGGLDPTLLAAVMIAVRAHIRVRRKQAAPAMRAHAPGSLPSRWTSIGRGRQVRGW